MAHRYWRETPGSSKGQLKGEVVTQIEKKRSSTWKREIWDEPRHYLQLWFSNYGDPRRGPTIALEGKLEGETFPTRHPLEKKKELGQLLEPSTGLLTSKGKLKGKMKGSGSFEKDFHYWYQLISALRYKWRNPIFLISTRSNNAFILNETVIRVTGRTWPTTGTRNWDQGELLRANIRAKWRVPNIGKPKTTCLSRVG